MVDSYHTTERLAWHKQINDSAELSLANSATIANSRTSIGDPDNLRLQMRLHAELNFARSEVVMNQRTSRLGDLTCGKMGEECICGCYGDMLVQLPYFQPPMPNPTTMVARTSPPQMGDLMCGKVGDQCDCGGCYDGSECLKAFFRSLGSVVKQEEMEIGRMESCDTASTFKREGSMYCPWAIDSSYSQ